MAALRHQRRLRPRRSRGEALGSQLLLDVDNARAHALGCELRLFFVDTHGDDYLFVALPPLACKSAVERGLLEVTPYVPHLPTRPRWSLWLVGVVLLPACSPSPTLSTRPHARRSKPFASWVL
ncbi:hypothetical protein [Polyangium sorediatum]|uniref:hypothetical protein n=1 Tax=Polyangium sorediatum TaxID=889274 RepID=UPI00113A02AF|nr:hypothetical protein [Polyangium sorediatum]